MSVSERFQWPEMSTLTKRGLIILGLILAFFIFDRAQSYSAALKNRQQVLQTQLLQLKAIEQSEDPEALLSSSLDRVASFEAVFFKEETIGLNTAKFQVELISILDACGAEQTVIDIQTSPSETIANIVFLDASVRMQADLLSASRCLDGLNANASRMEVDSLRWNMPRQFILQVRAFALASAGSDT